MILSERIARQTRTLLDNGKRIVCVCHRNPDGDAIGSLLGCGLLLRQEFSNRDVRLLCIDPVPESLCFLLSSMSIEQSVHLTSEDVILFLDCAEPSLTGIHHQYPHCFDQSWNVINIDHHVSNTRFGKVNIVIEESASTCEIVLALAAVYNWPLTCEIATDLLTGVYTDTGGLLHSNTTANVYRTVSALLRSGARHQLIVNSLFRMANMSMLKLWGRVLEKVTVSDEGAAISAVTEGDFRATGAKYSDLAGVIDYVNAVPGMRFSLVLSERDGKVKGSLRTLHDDVDVNTMAGRFHGGGHKKAAGFAVSGRLQSEMRWKVMSTDQVSAEEDSLPRSSKDEVDSSGGRGFGSETSFS
ncbi:hypothetical protein A3D11_02870 [Candidatus Peribacteria bacterium RIFCSPHIGHO2_02_FULL_49_16]|nr:MAG: hypothetical protein A2880_01690 [Candidatus Peribacteria bacterium RIFCSPHIGHO2_01_FULL_49_38]OGJ58532.1 MAG: hypothetical protein A3D11_02870 [Candidatus Peribacteria bacterium RIFCSPHIGHO2_02_FULL_49_16]